MVVKEKKGRRRYIAFSVSAGLRKEDLIRELRAIDQEKPPYVIQLAESKAIIRCPPNKKEETIAAVSRADPSSVSLITSGTIRKIRDIYPELKTAKK
jgi:RNase P/RNase MRP subunit POP5